MLVGAIFNFLGGAAFRYGLGRVIDWLEAKQRFKEETARGEQQERFAAAQHGRQLEQIRLVSELGLKEVQIKGDLALDLEAAKAFTAAQERAHVPTGIKFIDGWNGCIRPAAASLSLLIWALKFVKQGFEAAQWDVDLASSILGFYFADRHLGKRK